MKECHMIEPCEVPRHGMMDYGRTHSPCTKVVAGLPLIMDLVFRTVGFNYSPALCLKYRLPSPARQVMVVAHEHPSKALKFLTNTWIDPFVNLAGIHYGRLSTLFCGDLTPKGKLAGKSQGRGVFIVRRNLLISGILRR